MKMAIESNDPIFPEEDFGIVEVDCSPYLTDEQTKWPVLTWSQNEDFAIEEPLPSLVLNFNTAPVALEDVSDPIPTLLACISDYEKGIGGHGLRFAQETASTGHVQFRGSPMEPQGAKDRLRRVAEFVSLISAANAVADVA
jgi:hypothetical protein